MTDRLNPSALGDAVEGRMGRIQQAPVRNESLVGAAIDSHSGEFAPVAIDLRLPGRGVDFAFGRSYRSSHNPATADFPDGTSIPYAYDEHHRPAGDWLPLSFGVSAARGSAISAARSSRSAGRR
jgi:hypothetical protein